MNPHAVGRDKPAGSSRWTVVWQVGQFALAGLVAVGIVGFATAVASRRVGEREAIVDARTTTLVKAQGVVEPAVTEALLEADPAAVAEVDQVVQSEVLDDSLVRVKIWAPDGTIVYSDEPQLIGTKYVLGGDEEATILSGRIEAEVSDLSKPENRFERRWSKLLEVYLPIQTPSGEPLLFEAYFRYNAVTSSGSRLWRSFAPISLGALVALELVTIPLAWSLSRRLRARQREREVLLHRALEASEVERRRIAADLHDGVVQDLAGVAYSLSAAARQQGETTDNGRMLEDSAAGVRSSIKALRSLLVEIYPPNLEEEGLESALQDLLAKTHGRGVTARLETSGIRTQPPGPVAGLLYRAAQEGLRNVVNHADATSVLVRVRADDEIAVLDVEDNGRGFDPAEVAATKPGEGHVGLKGLAGLVADAGGVVEVHSAPGKGTKLRVEVPVK